MAEQMDIPPKQLAGFLDLLIETATTQTKKLDEYYDHQDLASW